MKGLSNSRAWPTVAAAALLFIPVASSAVAWGLDVRNWPSNSTKYEYWSSRYGGTHGSVVVFTPPSSAGGTIDSTGLALSVRGNATQITGLDSSTTNSFADFATATIRSQHQDTSFANGTYMFGRTLAQLCDILTFTNPSAGASDVTNVPYTLTLRGSMEKVAPGGPASLPHNSLTAVLYVDNLSWDVADVSINLTSGSGYLPVVTPGFGSWSYSDSHLLTFNGTMSFTGTSGSHTVLYYLDSVGGATASDYTLSLSLGLPSTVGMTSASGGFLHGTVMGKVVLQDFIPGPKDQVIDFELREPSTGAVQDTKSATLDDSGQYSFQTSLRGSYDVVARGLTWLGHNFGAVSVTDVGAANVDFSLINGDVDGDNAVTVFDYSLLSDAFDSVPGDGNWLAAADLDGDGAVTVFDYDILSQSFDMTGA